MSDFSPQTRNSAWWSGDSRLAAQGKANEAILIKAGQDGTPRPIAGGSCPDGARYGACYRQARAGQAQGRANKGRGGSHAS
jgi:hypothetical protein